MSLEIRPVRDDELERVGKITVEAYRADGLLSEDVGYERVLADAAGRAEQAELWVAVEGEEVLGGVTFCRPGTPYAELAGEREGEFRMLAVDPALRRRGAARALVQHCVARSQELGYDAVVLSSMAQMKGAHRLYEGLGFERVPDRDWTPVPTVELLAFRLPLA
jgi:ribosomal protein S18 acetylase RimI-like enzyme